MNVINKIFDEDIDDIQSVLLSDNVWYKVDSLDVKGHFGQNPQYFSLMTKVDEKHGELMLTRKLRICGKTSDIKLIDVGYIGEINEST